MSAVCKIDDILQDMTVLDDRMEYYLVTLTAEDDEKSIISTQTEWIGFADEARRIEMRQPSLVNATRILENLSVTGYGSMIVKNDDQWPLFWLLGGFALVEMGVAKRAMPRMFSSDAHLECVQTGELGFMSVASLPEGARDRAPRPRLRMRVFDRDARRCRICGRSPRDYYDVELHAHHIRPWAKGGVTVQENLITLCHTCHKGLEPHFDWSLYRYIPKERNQAFLESVQRHCSRVQKALRKAACQSQTKNRFRSAQRRGRG
jgi:hypothetical protein